MNSSPFLQKYTLYFLLLTLVCSIPVSAASLLKVDRISFEKLGREDWLRCRLQISSDGSLSESAADSRFLDDVKARLYLSFRKSGKDFSFYTCEVEIVTMEQGERYYLDYFLPGPVVKRDRLNTNPFAYLVEFTVGGYSVPFENEFGSSNMDQISARQMFKDKADASKQENDGILLPSFLAPDYLTSEYGELYPAFRRRITNY